MSTLSATIQADTSGFNKAVEDSKKILDKFNKKAEETEKDLKKFNSVTREQASNFNKSVQAMQKAASGAKNYKNAAKTLNTEIEKMKLLYQSLNKETQQGAFGTTLKNQIQAATEKVKQFSFTLDSNKSKFRSLKGDSPFKEMQGQLTGIGGSLNGIIGSVTKLGTAASVAASSFKLIKDAINESERLSDWMNAMQAGGQNAYADRKSVV